jgi:hypothetical protein
MSPRFSIKKTLPLHPASVALLGSFKRPWWIRFFILTTFEPKATLNPDESGAKQRSHRTQRITWNHGTPRKVMKMEFHEKVRIISVQSVVGKKIGGVETRRRAGSLVSG